MDKKALYNLSCGVFMLASKADGKENGCITNTCIQVANNPVRISVSVLNTNYTCEFIKKSGLFALSVLDDTCTFETIRHFGLQSGRDVVKFGCAELRDKNGIPYLGWQACAMLGCHVVSSQDLGSHTLFIAEVDEAKVLSRNAPLTYADYQSRIKPKREEAKEEPGRRIIGWRCKICRYYYEGSELPKDYFCPLCGHGPEDFEPVYAS